MESSVDQKVVVKGLYKDTANIVATLGTAARALRAQGKQAEADDMCRRVRVAVDFEERLRIIEEYVVNVDV